ncbi:MALT paracaspase 2 [Synchiropus picturatus]
MDVCNMNILCLKENILDRLSLLLDNSTCGWRQLACAASQDPKLSCSESELTNCSLRVLSPSGSPGRALLTLLADRACGLMSLLTCLRKINHQEAVTLITTSLMETILITVEPQSQQVATGAKVVLTCRASGPPGLSYQWFKSREQISIGTTPDLVLGPVTQSDAGHYICRVNHGDNCAFSQWAHVRLLQSADPDTGMFSSLFPGSVSGLCFLHQPCSTSVSEGDSLTLECRAIANPPPQYEWYHDTVALPQSKTPSLTIPCVTTAHRGQYRCKVFNLYHEAWSDPASVSVGPSSVTDASWVEIDRGSGAVESKRSTGAQGGEPLRQVDSLSLETKTFYATDKVALLMGNMSYVHHPQLCAPIADVHELANLLRQMDFKVVSLLDLNLNEMHAAVTEFLLLLDQGVYGLLYFAGHGYENFGNSFMVPIDAPTRYTSKHCMCVQNILTRMQEKKTGLNVFLLDMCRKRNPNDSLLVQPGLLKVTSNIVFGYATCADAEAYEVKRDDVSNGIFISFLKHRVCEDEKVTFMLDKVAEDMGHCCLTRGRQALELRSNLSERRSLTDQINTQDCCAAYSARNMQWAVAHVLPDSRFVEFDCGVKVQLGFAAEFSNVMVIYTRILDHPGEIVSCSAQLTDFPEDVGVNLKKTNQDTLIEAGSLCLIKENFPSHDTLVLYTRVQQLQRLERELIFTVCLHYTYSNIDEEVQERKTVSVGKPLVSKLNLHEARPACTPSGPSDFTQDSSSALETLSGDLLAEAMKMSPHDV